MGCGTSAPAVANSVCGSPNKQADWRWCSRCGNLHFANASQNCGVTGGAHDQKGSGRYHVSHVAHGPCGTQDKWKWCKRCGCLCYSGLGNGSCTANGAHDFSDSGDYHLCKNNVHGQNGWVWCCKCQVLFWNDSKGNSKCPASGGQHDSTGSSTYQVGQDQ